MNVSPNQPADIDPSAAELLARAAAGLWGKGRTGLAREAAELALRADGDLGSAHSAMAGILDSLGEFGGALHHWREAARLMPNVPGARLNLALALLASGDWDAGLPLYEDPLANAGWSSMAALGTLEAVRDRIASPETPLHGRRVLVVSEQGMGDAIWSARFLAPLAARGAAVILATGASLASFLERIAGPSRVLSPPAEAPDGRINLRAPAAAHDHVVPMMSLPWLLGIRPERRESRRVPYLTLDADAVLGWRRRYREALPGARLIVGVIWRVNPRGPGADSRTIEAGDFAPFADLPDVGFVNLQGGDPAGRTAIMGVLLGVHDALATGLQFAEAIAATDILVTADTFGAHLAGAMGHPAIVPLPTAPHFMFYWGHSGDQSVWYPSLRLVRQTRYRDWSGPIAESREMLADAAERQVG